MNKDISLVVVPRLEKGDKYFSQDWLRRLLDAPDNARDRAYLTYHVQTGLRVSDVVNTEIVHIDWNEHKTYTYDHKKDKWRFVYWPAHVKPVLQMWLKQRQAEGIKSPKLFPFCEKTAGRILEKWSRSIGHPNAHRVGTHWLRHTFIRLSRKVGRDIKAVQQNTGDTVKTLLEWYSDLSSEDLQLEIKKELMP